LISFPEVTKIFQFTSKSCLSLKSMLLTTCSAVLPSIPHARPAQKPPFSRFSASKENAVRLFASTCAHFPASCPATVADSHERFFQGRNFPDSDPWVTLKPQGHGSSVSTLLIPPRATEHLERPLFDVWPPSAHRWR
jgi:hypothetical protein